MGEPSWRHPFFVESYNFVIKTGRFIGYFIYFLLNLQLNLLLLFLSPK